MGIFFDISIGLHLYYPAAHNLWVEKPGAGLGGNDGADYGLISALMAKWIRRSIDIGTLRQAHHYMWVTETAQLI